MTAVPKRLGGCPTAADNAIHDSSAARCALPDIPRASWFQGKRSSTTKEGSKETRRRRRRHSNRQCVSHHHRRRRSHRSAAELTRSASSLQKLSVISAAATAAWRQALLPCSPAATGTPEPRKDGEATTIRDNESGDSPKSNVLCVGDRERGACEVF